MVLQLNRGYYCLYWVLCGYYSFFLSRSIFSLRIVIFLLSLVFFPIIYYGKESLKNIIFLKWCRSWKLSDKHSSSW